MSTPGSNTMSTTASNTINKMAANPSTAHKMANVVSQLDDEGKAQLDELVGEFDKGRHRRRERPKGQVASPDYHEQNPWHDQEREAVKFSLGEPFPRRDEAEDPEQAKQGRPVFSLGQPLPHTVRRRGRSDAAKLRQEDVEQGWKEGRKQGREEGRKEGRKEDQSRTFKETGAADSDESGETLAAEPEPNWMQTAKTQSLRAARTQSKTDQDEGTDMARRFQVDADTIGQREDSKVEEGKVDPNAMRNRWARFRAKYPEPLAEFLCTTMSVFLGLCGTLSVNLSQNQSMQYGTFETLCWAWGLAFMFGIYLGGGVSGAHMNPAISISLSIYRGFPWRRCGLYVVIQVLASFTGGGLAYCLYRDAILQVDPGLTETYTSWFTVPKPWVSPATGFFSEFLGGAVIMVAVLSLGDDQNNPPGAGMHAFIIGLLVTVLKMTLGYNTGAALSPASDLGPRLVALAVGYQTDNLFKTGWWAYGPVRISSIVQGRKRKTAKALCLFQWGGTLSGAIIGCALYDAIVFVGSESPINYRWSKEKNPWHAAFNKLT
ncbi:hypothetical protein VSDG_01457 [Cytospora chrysosperma]|uniref:Aquaporin n=1 Tax=Cytospora chrysosperma TaxID=252740 RepID=A0A423WJG4_CYTCH|nr:hypothetical protein VSDG_01457 [Valsa sordida]